MALSCSIASQRHTLDPQAAHCAAFEEILSRYVDHYYTAHQKIGLHEDAKVEQFIELASTTCHVNKEFISAINLDLDLDWEDCLNVGEAGGAWAFDDYSGLVLIAISPNVFHACERLAGRFLNPW